MTTADNQINEYDCLSYSQQYEFLCNESGCKQCQRCKFWVSSLSDGICEDCEYDLEEERRNTDDYY